MDLGGGTSVEGAMSAENTTLQSLLSWLDTHINYERTGMGSGDGAEHDPGRRLETMLAFLDIMDNPQNLYPSIHLTGTNGKTSTSRMVTSLLMAQGLRTGTYTSPHLLKINERISVNGEPVSDPEMFELLLALQLLEPMLQDARLSFFELVTSAAFRHFADAPVEAAVIEVGVGGKWDATNVIDAHVAVITNVGLDHQNYLGATRELIAEQKAGIVKEQSALVLAEPDAHLHEFFTSRTQAPVYVVGKDFAAEDDRIAVGGRLVDLRTPSGRYEDVFVGLHGRHQSQNAATALMAVEAFFGEALHEDVVRQGFAAATSPGRLEVVSRRPLCVVDGAHNEAGAAALLRALDEEFAVDGERVLVVGMLEPHDPRSILEALQASRSRLVIACTPDSPRAVPAAAIADAAKAMGALSVVVEDPRAAAKEARSVATEDDLVVVTGSLYVVGAARDELLER
jgi:dihydrofolate synthase/folylpolyglutamate synthase